MGIAVSIPPPLSSLARNMRMNLTIASATMSVLVTFFWKIAEWSATSFVIP